MWVISFDFREVLQSRFCYLHGTDETSETQKFLNNGIAK